MPTTMCAAWMPVMMKYSAKKICTPPDGSTFGMCRPAVLKCGPGTRWCSNFDAYSKYLTTRKVVPSRIVRMRLITWPLREPTCADRTASTIVSELQISTPVFIAPSGTFSALLPATHASGYIVR